jgi:hypothetical protein
MTTPTTINYQAAQSHTSDLIRAANRARRAQRPGRVRSTGPSRRALMRRLRWA